MGPLIANLEKRFPNIVLEIYESPSAYLGAHLINEHVDLSILVDYAGMSGIEAIPLVDEDLYFAQPRANPFLETDADITLAELAGVPLMLTTNATTLRQTVNQAFANAGVVPVVKAEASSVHTLLSMVSRGGAGTIIPPSVLSWPGADEYLRSTVITPKIVRRAFIANSRLNRLSVTADSVRTVIRSMATSMIEEGEWVGARLPLADAEP